ncbi:unnamed protein product [Rotaria sp. Silwood2]|nr:unnamed protein product [Rotaria sp. Silwood2]
MYVFAYKVSCYHQNQLNTCMYKGYAVTIIVEGGLGTLEVVENDINEKRPIVLIQVRITKLSVIFIGSGRLADVLAMLVEQTSKPDQNQYWNPSDEEIEQALDLFFHSASYSDASTVKERIKKILQKEHRYLLHIFSMNHDKNVVETIFKAIFTENHQQDNTESLEQDKLVDLALEWNYFDGALPILQARQDEILKIQRKIMKREHSSEKNHSTFIEYFLITGFDPLTLVEEDNISSYQTFISDLYVDTYDAMSKSHRNRIETLFGELPLKSIQELNYKLNKFVGPFFGSIYSPIDDSFVSRIKIDLSNHVFTCCKLHEYVEDNHDSKGNHDNGKNNQTNNKYTKHHMLRDLFLWSVFMDMPEMAKVLLLHVQSRICAALIATTIFKKYSNSSDTVDLKSKFLTQSLEFETYAAILIDKCYEHNEKRACELLLRQIPLFGNVTCMQVAISSENKKLLKTACFDQTLNHIWYNKLSLTNRQTSELLPQISSILTFGLISPRFITYRKENEQSLNYIKDDLLSEEGINYYVDKQNSKEGKCTTYWRLFRYFHESPLIKMSYHFISYVWFLLAFSYMMLYHLDGRNTFTIPHWTEIYVIITVSTMLCEEARRLYYEYDTRMTERWGSTGSAILTVLSNIFYIMPYILFYFGLGFRYGSYNEDLLTTARIVWALDLELWYLRSLKFVMALKFVGPKLFMLKNMLRDLFAFVYMVFIALTAYGVVSRALILYKKVPFTGYGILSQVFYEPYWFIYGEVSDKDLLDKIINNDNVSTTANGAEATATHVLLAFHMLFINILLLNLITAVFTHSIDEVRENTDFYWRYQRYSFVREYFERLPLSYPPLIAISHIILLFLTIRRICCSKFGRNRVATKNYVPLSKKFTRVFKMIPTDDSQNEQWDSFENAATYSYARLVLEKK